MPYRRYSAVRDARTRPEHLTGHGAVCAGTIRSGAATTGRRAGTPPGPGAPGDLARDIEAGGIALGDDSFPERFHRALTPALEAERDAATIDPALRPGNKLSRNARQATRVLPATWIDRANDTPVQVVKRSKNSPFLGRYEQADP